MLVSEFTAKLLQIKAVLTKNRDADTLLIAREARALIVRRIQNDHKKADGSSLGSYSTNPLPDFYYYGRSLNAGNERKVRAVLSQSKTGLSYKGFRQLNNLPTDAVDLTFTGQMWKETVSELQASNQDRTIAVIAGRTTRAKRLLSFNSDRYGNVLRISQDERRMLQIANAQRVLKVIRSIL